MSEKDKRRMILDSALKLIREKGLEGTRIIDIANGAGIGKGTVYDYFTSKEEVIAATVKDVVDRDFKDIFVVMDRAETLEAKLQAFLEAYCHILKLYGPFLMLFAGEEMKKEEESSDVIRNAVEEIWTDHMRRIRDIVTFGMETGVLKEELNVDMAATYILSVTLGYAFSGMKEQCSEELSVSPEMTGFAAVQADRVVELILGGIRREKEDSHE